MIDFDVAVIIPAAGSGERMEGMSRKQFLNVLSKPLYVYAVEAFHRLPFVKKIVLVLPSYKDEEGRKALEPLRNKLVIAEGSTSRHRSILAGLNKLHADVVIIHDAVRPLVPESLVEDLVKAAKEHGAAGAVRPLLSTVLKPTADNFLHEALPRNDYVSSETPQAFEYEALTEAYSKCTDEELDNGTECLQLAQLYSMARPVLLPGPPSLWKVTLKKDLYSAVGCIQEKNSEICIVSQPQCFPATNLHFKLAGVVSRIQLMYSVPVTQLSTENTFSTVVVFYSMKDFQDCLQSNFANEGNITRTGLLIRVIGCVPIGFRAESSTLEPGVAVVCYSDLDSLERLVDMLASMVMAPSHAFSQQSLFV